MKSIGVIGTGNLGTHLVQLLCRNKLHDFIILSDEDNTKAELLGKEYNLDTLSTNDNIHRSDIIFLTVKPDNIKSVCGNIRDITKCTFANQEKLIISTAAGVPIEKIKEWSGTKNKVIRCMPNIPISIGQGSIVWYGDSYGKLEQDKDFLKILTSGPQSYWVESEDMIDAATVVSGCIPAYISKIFQTYMNVGKEMGFEEDLIKKILINGFVGTSNLINKVDTKNIIEQVASKGGATEKGLEIMENAGLGQMIKKSSDESLKQIKNITKSLD